MKILFILLLVFYLIGVFVSFLSGIIGMIMFSEFGEEDGDYIASVIFFKYALVFPIAIKKVIQYRLENTI